MSEENENLDLFDEVEEVVSRDGKKVKRRGIFLLPNILTCLLYTSPSPRDRTRSRMPSSA